MIIVQSKPAKTLDTESMVLALIIVLGAAVGGFTTGWATVGDAGCCPLEIGAAVGGLTTDGATVGDGKATVGDALIGAEEGGSVGDTARQRIVGNPFLQRRVSARLWSRK